MALLELLLPWVLRQRWYSGSPDAVLTCPFEPASLPDPGGRAQILLVALAPSAGASGSSGAGDAGATYLVPVTLRAAPEPTLAHALIGVCPVDGVGHWVYDAPHDAAFVEALVGLIASEAGTPEAFGALGAFSIRGELAAGATPPAAGRGGYVLVGEQSNTSIIVAGQDDPAPVIVKLFRVLQAGANPDVEVLRVLTERGCDRVPRLAGWVSGAWPDGSGGRAQGHLASMTEFLPGSEDAWRIAGRAVATDVPFTEQARELGRATAQVHATLATAAPPVPATAERVAGLIGQLRERLEWAIAEVPDLAFARESALRCYDGLAGLDWPDLQPIHGDLHLGQILHSPGRGWVLIDFEGEPLRPIASRHDPDLALRDVAGLVRSFDYAAGFAVLGQDGAAEPADPLAAARWATDARQAFLAGYREGADSGADPETAAESSAEAGSRASAALLHALELDKALYEAVYEKKHRPDWLPVPLQAIRRLTA